ncbi:MAG: selenium metabolism-associated LysR family transcriptional regulator [Deltaproteobacteria bacterium]|nr:selenium metabolism-associated LysR family transcriptional regulator [Deltaproteobacteria bacterium]
MDIKQLEIFARIVDLKSFSKAAEAVYLTQPTVSGHIQSLEEELGQKLLDRLGREVVPTKAGKVLYEYAKKMVALRDEAGQALDQLLGRMKGEIVIGGSTIPGEYLLPTIIGRFREKYHEITVVLKIGDTADIVNRVLTGECEVGIVGSRVEDSRLEYSEFVKDELIIIAASNYTMAKKEGITASALASIPFVMRERGSGSRMTIEKRLLEIGVDPSEINIVAEMGSTEAVKQAVKAGLGVSIVSSVAVAEDLRHNSLKVIPFKGKRFLRSFYIATHRGRTMSPIGQAFLDFLKKD